jgi:hypothetical protein
LKQNFSKQVFGYFLAAKSDKEKKIPKKMELVEKDCFLLRCHPNGVFVWKNMFFYYKDAIPQGLAMWKDL